MAWPLLPTSASSNLSTLPPQWPAGLEPTSVESRASVCRAHRGPTRTRTASSAARRAPAAMGLAQPVPTTYPNVEASVGPPWKGRPQPGGQESLPGLPKQRPGALCYFVKLFAASRACHDFPCSCISKVPCRPSAPTVSKHWLHLEVASCSLERTLQFTNTWSFTGHLTTYNGGYCFMVNQTCYLVWSTPSSKCCMECAVTWTRTCPTQRTLQFALTMAWKALFQFTKHDSVCQWLYHLLSHSTSSVKWVHSSTTTTTSLPSWAIVGSPERMGGEGRTCEGGEMGSLGW